MRTRLMLGGGAAGLVGAALLVAGFLDQPRHALYSYLVAFTFAWSVSLGALALLLIGHVTGARWFVVMRRGAELLASALPLLALLALPIFAFLDVLYPWVPPFEGMPAHVVTAVRAKQAWLDERFFVARGALYLVVWSAMAELLRAWSRRQDDDDDAALVSRQRAFSGAMLPLFAFTLTFAAFDWLMSLEPAWYSNAFGFYLFTGCFLAGTAALIVVAARARALVALPHDVERSLFHVLGKLLLAAVILWAYIAFAQFFLLWIANLPEEASWYVTRTQGDWGALAVVVVVGRFALPFFALLSKPLKRRPRALAFVAAWLLLFHLLDLYWLVMPALHPEGIHLDWTTPAALLGLGGFTSAFVALRSRSLHVVPRRDPRLRAGMEYRTS